MIAEIAGFYSFICSLTYVLPIQDLILELVIRRLDIHRQLVHNLTLLVILPMVTELYEIR